MCWRLLAFLGQSPAGLAVCWAQPLYGRRQTKRNIYMLVSNIFESEGKNQPELAFPVLNNHRCQGNSSWSGGQKLPLHLASKFRPKTKNPDYIKTICLLSIKTMYGRALQRAIRRPIRPASLGGHTSRPAACRRVWFSLICIYAYFLCQVNISQDNISQGNISRWIISWWTYIKTRHTCLAFLDLHLCVLFVLFM